MKSTKHLRLVVTTLLLFVACAATVQAATLILEGPHGLPVSLDGKELGVLPLNEINIETGDHEVICELAGTETLNTGFTVVEESEIVHLYLRPQPLSRKEAALSSLAFAGLGQRYEDKHTLGWILGGAEALGLITALISDLSAQNSRDEYNLALAEYQNALTPDDIEQWRTTAEGHHDDWQTQIDRRKAGLTLAAGAVAVSLLDALIRFPALDAGVDLSSVGPQADTAMSRPNTFAPSVHLALRLGF